MAVRMDVELTSARPDGTWTWRAAGARQPKGDLDGSLLFAGAKVGDVVKVEADVEVDGITIHSVLPPKAPRREPERLQLLARPGEAGVTTSLVPGRRRDEGRRGQSRDGSERRDRGDRGERRDRGDRRDRGPARERREPREAGRRPPRTGDRGPRRDAAPRPTAADEAQPPRPKPKRLQVGRAHRDAALASMAPEEVPVAEQLFRGGIPAVRAAVDAQNEEAKKAGQPTISAEPLLALAESLLPRVRAAEWRDRADAVLGAGEDAPLRDLRAVVAAADAAARDDDTRKVATMLREALDQRRAAARQKWLDDITSALDEQRVLRALRISGRGPEPGSRLPIDLARRLSDDAGAALSPDAGPERWSAVLDAVAQSPVRTSVQPAGLPADPGDELLSTARAAAARVPGVGRLLGIEPARPPRPGAIPPPPSPEAAGG